MADGIEIKGVKEAQKALTAVGAFFAGQTEAGQKDIRTIVGSDLRGAAKTAVGTIHHHKGKGGALKRSIKYLSVGNTSIDLYADLSIAPYARMRELGGVIKATMSAFRNRKTGERLLFIPLVQGLLPRDWKGKKFGVDFVLTPQVTQKGSFFMRNAIRTRLTNRGRSPKLSHKLGFAVDKIFDRKSLKGL